MKLIAFYLLSCLLATGAGAPTPSDNEICLTAEETKLYDMIMEYRKSKKLKTIPYSSKLTNVAQTHVRDLAANYNYETQHGLCNPHSWSDKGKWSSCCYTPDHKVAKCMWDKPREISGYSGDGFEIAYFNSGSATAPDALTGWKNSSGHNPLLVNTGIWTNVAWKAIGLGIYQNYAVVWFGEVDDPSEQVVCR